MARYAIREATDADSEGISDLLEHLGYPLPAEGVARRLHEYRNTGGHVWVATVGQRIVGFLSFHVLPYFHTEGIGGRITAMCVRPDYRRQGVGAALLVAMEGEAERIGCERIEVTSGDHRKDDAHPFYEASGYAFSTGRFLKQLKNTEQDPGGKGD